MEKTRAAYDSEVLSLVKAHPNYNLSPYQAILEEMIKHAGSIDGMKGKHLLELGPGTRIDLMRFVSVEIPLRWLREPGGPPSGRGYGTGILSMSI